mmetsp:Transcript_119807/g.346234  ORF Transcript_119807/g.346234 Transcript_119807/m.346234 type:complete len:106 (+) Transcript_119807:199-516(+)
MIYCGICDGVWARIMSGYWHGSEGMIWVRCMPCRNDIFEGRILHRHLKAHASAFFVKKNEELATRMILYQAIKKHPLKMKSIRRNRFLQSSIVFPTKRKLPKINF